MTDLSEKVKKEYVQSGGLRCPYCSSEDVDCFGEDFDETGIYKYIRCERCDERWTEVYKLVEIIPEEE